jgi:hypothetical protein
VGAGQQSAGMVNKWKVSKAKSVLYKMSVESGGRSGQYFICDSKINLVTS